MIGGNIKRCTLIYVDTKGEDHMIGSPKIGEMER